MAENEEITIADVSATLTEALDGALGLCVAALKAQGRKLGEAGMLTAAFEIAHALAFARRMGYTLDHVQHAWRKLEERDAADKENAQKIRAGLS